MSEVPHRALPPMDDLETAVTERIYRPGPLVRITRAMVGEVRGAYRRWVALRFPPPAQWTPEDEALLASIDAALAPEVPAPLRARTTVPPTPTTPAEPSRELTFLEWLKLWPRLARLTLAIVRDELATIRRAVCS